MPALRLPRNLYIYFYNFLHPQTYLAEHVDELALALVSPLRAEDDVNAILGAGHGLPPGQLGLSHILLAAGSGDGGALLDADGFLDFGNTGRDVGQERQDWGLLIAGRLALGHGGLVRFGRREQVRGAGRTADGTPGCEEGRLAGGGCYSAEHFVSLFSVDIYTRGE